MSRRLEELRDAGLVFISHGKSGRTWVRVMLSHIYHLRYGVPADQLVEGDNFHRHDGRIPICFFTHDQNEDAPVRMELVRDRLAAKKVVFLVRDPRDVLVSRYHHRAFRHSTEKRERAGLPRDMAEMPVIDFARHPRLGLPAVIDIMNKWHAETAGLPQALRLRYEDLLADTEGQLGRLTAFLGERCSSEEIAAATSFASFQSMQSKEREGFFQTDVLRPADPGNPESFKVRRGVAGGYRDYFTAGEQEELERIVRSRLDPAFGYA
ncbi:sulfotransferase domain-containing protein [Marinimicrococcus flavescens]|uniref:Sulfotransferase domain-containing protein n=1 Tax=Marinimicrococcus flavescens TaxID=3031815 RepID=A0AAP3UZP2_9PROT|nr:sulfotransferase domain-containing protein [Marinimicrococcus flavescens]